MLKADKYYEYYADFGSKWADDEYEYNKGEFEGEELEDYAESLNRAEERFYDAVESHFEEFELPFEIDNLKILEISSNGYYVEITFKLLKDMEEEDIKKEIRKEFDYTRWVKFYGYEIEVGLYSGKYYKTCIKETIGESDYISEEEIFKDKVDDIKNNTVLCYIPMKWISSDTVVEGIQEDPYDIEDTNIRYSVFLKNIRNAEEFDYKQLFADTDETFNNNIKDDVIQFMRKYHTFIQNKVFIPNTDDVYIYNEYNEDEDFYDKVVKTYRRLIGWTGILEGFVINVEGGLCAIFIILNDIKKIDIEIEY